MSPTTPTSSSSSIPADFPPAHPAPLIAPPHRHITTHQVVAGGGGGGSSRPSPGGNNNNNSSSQQPTPALFVSAQPVFDATLPSLVQADGGSVPGLTLYNLYTTSGFPPRVPAAGDDIRRYATRDYPSMAGVGPTPLRAPPGEEAGGEEGVVDSDDDDDDSEEAAAGNDGSRSAAGNGAAKKEGSQMSERRRRRRGGGEEEEGGGGEGGGRGGGGWSGGGTVLRMVDFAPGAVVPLHRTRSLDYCVVLQGEIEAFLADAPHHQTPTATSADTVSSAATAKLPSHPASSRGSNPASSSAAAGDKQQQQRARTTTTTTATDSASATTTSRLLRAGDVVVLRGTLHGWRNASAAEPARLLMVLQSCEAVVVGAGADGAATAAGGGGRAAGGEKQGRALEEILPWATQGRRRARE